jgi:hypothetical protein
MGQRGEEKKRKPINLLSTDREEVEMRGEREEVNNNVESNRRTPHHHHQGDACDQTCTDRSHSTVRVVTEG